LALYNVKTNILATLRKALYSTVPVLPIGVSRHFWAVAYVCIGASPNKSYFIFEHNITSNNESVKLFYEKNPLIPLFTL